MPAPMADLSMQQLSFLALPVVAFALLFTEWIRNDMIFVWVGMPLTVLVAPTMMWLAPVLWFH
jgi:hypothetical protein